MDYDETISKNYSSEIPSKHGPLRIGRIAHTLFTNERSLHFFIDQQREFKSLGGFLRNPFNMQSGYSEILIRRVTLSPLEAIGGPTPFVILFLGGALNVTKFRIQIYTDVIRGLPKIHNLDTSTSTVFIRIYPW